MQDSQAISTLKKVNFMQRLHVHYSHKAVSAFCLRIYCGAIVFTSRTQSAFKRAASRCGKIYIPHCRQKDFRTILLRGNEPRTQYNKLPSSVARHSRFSGILRLNSTNAVLFMHRKRYRGL